MIGGRRRILTQSGARLDMSQIANARSRVIWPVRVTLEPGSGQVVEIDRLADALDRRIGIEPAVIGGVARARELRHGDPASDVLARREDVHLRQRLTAQVRRAAVREAEVSDPKLP